MKKYIFKILMATLVLWAPVLICRGQGGVNLRIAINSGIFLSEPGASNAVADPFAVLNSEPGGLEKFKPNIKLGIEAGLYIPIGDYFGIGFDVEDSKYAGHNDNPVYYNYFASSYSPILNYNQEPLIYNTQVVNFLGNLRIFPLGHGVVSPFIKLYGGIGMIGTDLRFKNPEDQVEKADPLYSRGTRLSVVEPNRFQTAHFGGGPGFEYQLAGNLSLCTELTFSYINSDIINGVPNFSYDEGQGLSFYDEVPSITSQLSVGVCYRIGGKNGFAKGGHNKSGGIRRGKTFRRSSVFGR
jgi:hypothetical protein